MVVTVARLRPTEKSNNELKLQPPYHIGRRREYSCHIWQLSMVVPNVRSGAPAHHFHICESDGEFSHFCKQGYFPRQQAEIVRTLRLWRASVGP
jgi:hypothetical protein